MSLFAISDLHLGFSVNKPMDKFGANWKDHPKKIANNWNFRVSDEDTVLVGGDISWASNKAEFAEDFAYIRKLSGRKVIGRGNHDNWWTSAANMSGMDENTEFVKIGFAKYEDVHICMTRGWLCPNDTLFTPHDEKIYRREIGRMDRAVSSAVSDGAKRIFVLMHYPPTNDKKESSGFTEIFKKYSVEKVIYGHLHGKESFDFSLKGQVDGTEYILTSSDYLNFMPKKIL